MMRKTLTAGDANVMLLYYALAIWAVQILSVFVLLILEMDYVIANEVLTFLTVFPIFLYALCSGVSLPRAINAKKFKGKHFVLVLLLVMFMYVVIVMATSVAASVIQLVGGTLPDYSELEEIMSAPTWAMLLIVCVGAPLMEEFVVRGVFLNGYRTVSRGYAIVLCGVIFGLMHMDLLRFVPTFIIGVMLAKVAVYTDSWWLAVIYHAAHNLISASEVVENAVFELPWRITDSLPALDTTLGQSMQGAYILILFAVCLLFSIIIIRRLKNDAPPEPRYEWAASAPRMRGAGIAGMILLGLLTLVSGAAYFIKI